MSKENNTISEKDKKEALDILVTLNLIVHLCTLDDPVGHLKGVIANYLTNDDPPLSIHTQTILSYLYYNVAIEFLKKECDAMYLFLKRG